jgi:arsenite oxidase small subunit
MGITRRSLAKGMVFFSTALAILPFGALYKYLSVPVPTIKLSRKKIANQSEIPLGGAKRFNYPTDDRPAVLIHLEKGDYEVKSSGNSNEVRNLTTDEFAAFDGVCTHLGCPSNWRSTEKGSACPCHGAVFSPIDGTVIAGPPPRPLPKIKLEIDANGDIYATGYESGLPLFGMESFVFEEEVE